MSHVDDGGPAFPSQELNADGTPYCLNLGMSLRAYIAVHRPAPDELGIKFAESLTGRPMPERGGMSLEAHTLECQRWWTDAGAAYSVMQADALIAALQAKPAAQVEFTLRGPVYANVMNYGEAAARVKPAEPTVAMVQAGARVHSACTSPPRTVERLVADVWKAMAAVAPGPQSSVDMERINRVVQLWSSGVEGSNVAMQDISRIIREHIASNG